MESVADLGTVAATARSKQRTMFKQKPLTVPGIFKRVMFSTFANQNVTLITRPKVGFIYAATFWRIKQTHRIQR